MEDRAVCAETETGNYDSLLGNSIELRNETAAKRAVQPDTSIAQVHRGSQDRGDDEMNYCTREVRSNTSAVVPILGQN